MSEVLLAMTKLFKNCGVSLFWKVLHSWKSKLMTQGLLYYGELWISQKIFHWGGLSLMVSPVMQECWERGRMAQVQWVTPAQAAHQILLSSLEGEREGEGMPASRAGTVRCHSPSPPMRVGEGEWTMLVQWDTGAATILCLLAGLSLFLHGEGAGIVISTWSRCFFFW